MGKKEETEKKRKENVPLVNNWRELLGLEDSRLKHWYKGAGPLLCGMAGTAVLLFAVYISESSVEERMDDETGLLWTRRVANGPGLLAYQMGLVAEEDIHKANDAAIMGMVMVALTQIFISVFAVTAHMNRQMFVLHSTFMFLWFSMLGLCVLGLVSAGAIRAGAILRDKISPQIDEIIALKEIKNSK